MLFIGFLWLIELFYDILKKGNEWAIAIFSLVLIIVTQEYYYTNITAESTRLITAIPLDDDTVRLYDAVDGNRTILLSEQTSALIQRSVGKNNESEETVMGNIVVRQPNPDEEPINNTELLEATNNLELLESANDTELLESANDTELLEPENNTEFLEGATANSVPSTSPKTGRKITLNAIEKYDSKNLSNRKIETGGQVKFIDLLGSDSEPIMVDGERRPIRRRNRISDKPNLPLNLWGVMKTCVGKDLSRIPMPVNFNEPISMLQRLTESFEYTELLDYAAKCDDPSEQLAYVAAFSITSYSATANRTGKPFNPLLGETYECDRTEEMGWRYIAEQVQHHPPTTAIHCEGRGWRYWQDFTMSSKFRGKYLQITPLGNTVVQFDDIDRQYSWNANLTTTVHNIIVGKLWVDHHGEIEIIGHGDVAGYKCVLKYVPYSYFANEVHRRVSGVVSNPKNTAKWLIEGSWDFNLEITAVIKTTGPASKPIYDTGLYKTIWLRRQPDPASEKYYNFTVFACQLNQIEDNIAPTDSRLRPDQRLMEDGNWEESNNEKLRLEGKQRAKRFSYVQNENENIDIVQLQNAGYVPIWFKKVYKPETDTFEYIFNGEYWICKAEQDWSRCPDIF